MKIKEIRALGVAELGEKLKELEMECIKLGAQIATGSNPKNPGQLKKAKKTIAQIKTILTEKSKKPMEAKK